MTAAVTAVYPGTFDPLTLGHEDLLRRIAALFDRLIIAVAVAHHKNTLFSLQERLEMVREVAADLPCGLEVLPYDGLLRGFVYAQNASVVVRGLRSTADFEFESRLAGCNQKLMPDVQTIFLMPAAQYQCISSTIVREVAKLGGEVDAFVSPAVAARLRRVFHA